MKIKPLVQRWRLQHAVRRYGTGVVQIPEGMSHLEAAERAANRNNPVLLADVIVDGINNNQLDVRNGVMRAYLARLMVASLSARARIAIDIATKTMATLQLAEQADAELFGSLPELKDGWWRDRLRHGVWLQTSMALEAERKALRLAGAFDPADVPFTPYVATPEVAEPVEAFLRG